jgi:SAM-dependent methyltransferase
MRDYSRFDCFLNDRAGDVYPEVPSEPHLSITQSTIEDLHRDGLIGRDQRVLDVGCGQGIALEIFRQFGLRAVGVTLGPDFATCRAKGFEVYQMDQNFMDFADDEFDFLWCRHVLEHSVAPLFTLAEYHRVTKPDGLVYIEVPAPDTSAHHDMRTIQTTTASFPPRLGSRCFPAWDLRWSAASPSTSPCPADRTPIGLTSYGEAVEP